MTFAADLARVLSTGQALVAENTALLIASRRTYYVSPTGDDNAPGTSPDAPWKTLGRAALAGFMPGDSLLLERGGVYGPLTLPCSGTDGDLLTLGSYGSGPRPLLKGATAVTGMTLNTGAIWQKAQPADPYQVFEDGLRLIRAASKVAMVAGSYWWQSSNKTLYVWASDGASPAAHLIEASALTYGLIVNGQSYWQIEDVDLTQFINTGVMFQTVVGAHDIAVRRCRSSYNNIRGFGLGGYVDLATHDIVFTDCEGDHNNEEGFWIGNGQRNGLESCHVHDNGTDDILKGYKSLGGGITLGIRSVDCFVRDTYSHDNGKKSALLIEYESGYPRPVRTEVSGSHLVGAQLTALSSQGQDSLIHDNVLESIVPANVVQVENGSVNETYDDNTIVQTRNNWAVAATLASGLKFTRNRIACLGQGQPMLVQAAAQSGLQSDNNLWWADHVTFWGWGSGYPATLAAWQTASGQDAHSTFGAFS